MSRVRRLDLDRRRTERASGPAPFFLAFVQFILNDSRRP